MPRAAQPAPAGMKHCHGCGEPHGTSAFAKDASKSDGLKSRCRACDYARVCHARRAQMLKVAENARKQAAKEKRRALYTARKAAKRNPHGQAPWAMSQQNQR